MYAIEAGGELVGMIRLTPAGADTSEAETGVWLGRSVRGRGIGKAALRALIAEAAGAGVTTIVADTTPGNAAALALLRDVGATLTRDPDAAKVYARVRVPGGRSSSPELPASS